MTFYMVQYHYTDDTELRDRVRAEHRQFTAALHEQGVIRAGGPIMGAEPGAFLVVVADSVEQVQDALAKDPFAVQGVIAGQTITQWNPITGVFADQV